MIFYICTLHIVERQGEDESKAKRGFFVWTSPLGRRNYVYTYCTMGSSRQHTDKYFLIPKTQWKIAPMGFLLLYSVLIGKMYISIKNITYFLVFEPQYCARIIFNLTIESITVDRYKNGFNFFSFQQLAILTCKEESFYKILNFYKGKKWQNNNNICLLSRNIDMVLLQQNWFVLWSVSHR